MNHTYPDGCDGPLGGLEVMDQCFTLTMKTLPKTLVIPS